MCRQKGKRGLFYPPSLVLPLNGVVTGSSAPYSSLKALGSNYTLNLFHISQQPFLYFNGCFRLLFVNKALFRSPQIEIDLSRYGITFSLKAES